MRALDIRDAKNLTDLSVIVGCPAQKLGYYVYKRSPSTQYKSFSIHKKNGGMRTIHAPQTNLKIIQRSLSNELVKLRVFGPAVNGYVKDRSIKTNAGFHVGKKYVLNIDLQDFFNFITSKRLYGMLINKPYELHSKIASYIVNACTLNGVLPQGAPSSPILSNLICAKLDSELLSIARKLRCTYTRYADDITISSNSENIRQLVFMQISEEHGEITSGIGEFLKSIIVRNGFEINHKKIRFSNRGARQEVTGLIVNEKVNVKRRFVRQIRAMLYAWKTFGYPAAAQEYKDKYDYSQQGTEFINVVAGKISFVRQIKGVDDAVFQKLAVQFNELNDALSGENRVKSIRINISEKEQRERAIWVLEDHDSTNQGTAFFLKDVGLITCAHCLSKNMFIEHPLFPGKKYNVEVKEFDNHIDLAILELTDPTPPEATLLEQGDFSIANDGQLITLCGYPNHSSVFPVRVEEGKLIRTFVRSAVDYCEISARVIMGNSGGPILGENGKVIAVATTGINNAVLENNAQFFGVSIDMLESL